MFIGSNHNQIINFVCTLLFLVLQNCSASIYGQTIQYCDTSLNSKATAYYYDALNLDSLNKSGALTLLKKAVEIDTSFALALFKLGEIYHQKAILSQYDIQYQSHTRYYYRKASDSFIQSLMLCESIKNYAAYFYLGEQFYFQHEYSLAGHYLGLYLQKSQVSMPGFDIANIYYSNYIKWKWWKENPYDISITPLKNLCTEKDELFPSINSNGQFFYFTRKFDKQKPNSLFREQVKELNISYIESIDSNQNWIYSEGNKMDWPFNENMHFNELSANLLNNEMYLTYSEQRKISNKNIAVGNIYVSNKHYSYWEEPTKIKGKINIENIYDGQPCLSNNGKKLFFVSNRPDGYGGTDIYYCLKDSNELWSKPINLGGKINTINDEKMPFIHYDNKTLYFASNGHFGMGGLDLFISKLDKNGSWSTPINLGRPLNTPGNEQGLVLDARGIKGYFSSKSLPGYGGYDIFTTDIPNEFRPEEMIILNGRIRDIDSLPIPFNTVEIFNILANEKYEVLIDKESSTFSTIIPKQNNNYYIKIKADGYSFGNKILNGSQNSHTYFSDIELTPLKTGTKFFLNHIHFNRNADLDLSTNLIITDFASYIKKNKSLKLMIIGLKSSQNPDENPLITTKKANTIYSYLIRKGVSKNQVSYKNDTALISNIPVNNNTNSEILIEVININN